MSISSRFLILMVFALTPNFAWSSRCEVLEGPVGKLREEARVLKNNGDASRALEKTNAALAIVPADKALLKFKASVLTDLKRYPEALRVVESALKIYPESGGLILIKKSLYRKLGYDENIDLAVAIKITELITDVINLRAVGKNVDARALLDEAHVLAPQDSRVNSLRADTLMRLQQYNEALVILNDHLGRQHPRNPYDIGNKGIALLRLGRYAEANEAFTEELSFTPFNVPALSKKVEALIHLHHYEEALIYADRALSVNPRHQPLLRQKALLSVRLRKFEDARTVILSFNHIESTYLWLLARVEIELGRRDDAVDTLRHYIFTFHPKSDAETFKIARALIAATAENHPIRDELRSFTTDESVWEQLVEESRQLEWEHQGLVEYLNEILREM